MCRVALRGRSALLAAWLCCAVLPGGCRDAADRVGTPSHETGLPGTQPAFVGRRACVACHESEAQRWRGSDHDLAMQVADESTVLGDFADASFTHFGLTSTFFRRDGKFLLRTDGPDGKLHDYEIAYTFGAHPLQQYLVAFPGGRYQVPSLCWDSRPAAQGGQRWFDIHPDERIAPDDPLHWTGANQTWNFMCAECHSTNLAKNYRPEERRYETTWSEIDVSCEACHGPGSLHAAAAEAAARGDVPRGNAGAGLVVDLKTRDGGGWIVDPGAGTVTRSVPRATRTEIETCARCHSRRSVLTEDYVYGRPLMDSHRPALLNEPLYHADGQIREEVYVYGSFLQSRMYAAGVTCGDCHEPHGLRLLGEGASLCTRCHLPERFDTPAHHHHESGSPGAACVACHMPARTYMVVDPRRDHSLRVPRPDLSATLGTPNACSDCHADQSSQWAAETVTAWYGSARAAAPSLAEALHAGRVGRPGAREALMDLSRDPAAPAIVRATATAGLRAYADAQILPVVQAALGDTDPLARMAALRALEGLPPGARLGPASPLLGDPVRAVRIEAARLLAAVPPETMTDTQRSAFAHALDEYRTELRINADRPESFVNLGVLDVDLRLPGPAEEAYRRALEIDPAFSAAAVNLADLFRMQGRDEQGEEVLRLGMESAPDDAALLHALGLLLVRQGRLDEALGPLGRAAGLARSEPRYAYVFGIALHSAGRTDPALATLEQAHEQHPGDRDLLFALATINRDEGHAQQALEFAQQLVQLAPRDQAARRLLQSLDAARR